MFVDMHGKPCAKMVPVSAIDGLMADGAGFAGFAAGPMGQRPSSPDILAMPDLRSYMPAPWQPGLGIIQCDPHVLGEPWPFAPRVILRRQIQRLDGGLRAQGGRRGRVLPRPAHARGRHRGRGPAGPGQGSPATTPGR